MQRHHNGGASLKIRSQLKAHPESPWLHYTLASLLDNEGPAANTRAFEEAIQSAQQAVKLKPDFLEARNLLARMYMRSGQYSAVIEQCRLVVQADPSDESAIYHLIIALRRSGQDGQKDEIQQLVKRLTVLQQSSLQRETERNRYKLVEPETAAPK
jgi:tetratricopeptide (TPR) repeat protein